MLISEPTRHAAGIKIFGDYLDLQSFYETIFYLVDGVPLNGAESVFGEFVLGLAYEVRHAYQGDRESKQFEIGADGAVTYQGFRYLWPYILPTVGLLRWSASYHPTTRNVQANLFRIEECIENALVEIDPLIGEDVFEMQSNFSGLPEKYNLQFIDECALKYLTNATSRKARFEKLPEILSMMAPWREEYLEFTKKLKRIAKGEKCSPNDLTNREEWPDFKW